MKFECIAAFLRLELSTAFLLYLGCTMGTLLFLWVFHDLRARRRKIELSELSLHTCEFCHQCYLEDKTKEVTKCPACASYNKASKVSKA